MRRFVFRCSECRQEYEEDPTLLVCPACAEFQEAGGSTRGVLEVVASDLPTDWPDRDPSDPRFLAAFLPVVGPESFPAFRAGGTPLLPAPRLAASLGADRLWIKDDTRNPSGSTKDRASLLVAAKAREYGFETVAAASTGNAGTALAAVGAAAGLETIVFVPASAPEAKLVQMLSYGARVLPVEGSYDEAFELCLEACRELGWYNRNTALNPFTLEGKKTAALEIALSMSPEVPDVVVVPVGDGVILSGLARGFADLVAAGLTARAPRLIAVQPEGSGAIARAWMSGLEEARPVPGAHSVADSLTVEAPRNARLCLRHLRETDGGAVTVSDRQILAAIPDLAAATGVFAEPAAAAVVAGLGVALESGVVSREEAIVLMVTGSGLKDVPAAAR
ncbi:MAG: threonine synthase, partial [Candidatus Palauibacterales bacterium]|nr:threonine synthase [Candidatus Palauibacterales bacterium]